MTTRHLISIILLLLPMIVNGQSGRTITGTVSDMNDEPLAGVNIMLENTKVGTMSDSEGNFSIRIPDGGGKSDVLLSRNGDGCSQSYRQ